MFWKLLFCLVITGIMGFASPSEAQPTSYEIFTITNVLAGLKITHMACFFAIFYGYYKITLYIPQLIVGDIKAFFEIPFFIASILFCYVGNKLFNYEMSQLINVSIFNLIVIVCVVTAIILMSIIDNFLTKKDQ